MGKNPLTGGQMTSVEFVERAAWWSRELTRLRMRGPGDLENAMRGIGRDYAISYGQLWRLRYRLSQIKDIGVSVYHRLEVAYERECEAQRRKLELQCEATKAARGADYPLVLQTEALVGPEETPEIDAEGLAQQDR